MKILSEGTELYHAGRRTDRHDEIDSRFLRFCEGAQNNKNQTSTIIKTDKVHFHVLSRISIIIEGVGKENTNTHTELRNCTGIIQDAIIFLSNLFLLDSFKFLSPKWNKFTFKFIQTLYVT